MAGSWLAVVEGFGGMRIVDGVLSLEPRLPEAWQRLAFRIDYRGRVLSVEATHDRAIVSCEGEPVEILLCGERLKVDGRTERSMK